MKIHHGLVINISLEETNSTQSSGSNMTGIYLCVIDIFWYIF